MFARKSQYLRSFQYIETQSEQITNLLLLSNFYPLMIPTNPKRGRIAVYGISVSRYGPRAIYWRKWLEKVMSKWENCQVSLGFHCESTFTLRSRFVSLRLSFPPIGRLRNFSASLSFAVTRVIYRLETKRTVVPGKRGAGGREGAKFQFKFTDDHS